MGFLRYSFYLPTRLFILENCEKNKAVFVYFWCGADKATEAVMAGSRRKGQRWLPVFSISSKRKCIFAPNGIRDILDKHRVLEWVVSASSTVFYRLLEAEIYFPAIWTLINLRKVKHGCWARRFSPTEGSIFASVGSCESYLTSVNICILATNYYELRCNRRVSTKARPGPHFSTARCLG